MSGRFSRVVVSAIDKSKILGVRAGARSDGTAGVGGAMFYGSVIGIGGTLLGSLLARTAVLLRHSWKAVVATAVLVLLAVLTWGVYL